MILLVFTQKYKIDSKSQKATMLNQVKYNEAIMQLLQLSCTQVLLPL